MKIKPTTRVGQIEWAENHVDPWTTNAEAIGSSTAEIAAFAAKTLAARAAYQAQQAAQAAAVDATTNLNMAMEQMNDAAADIVKKVRAKAATDGNGIYALASIPAPAVPSPIGDPGMPYGFVATLQPEGWLEIRWKCDNPPRATGTIYTVYRNDGDGTWKNIGGAGMKRFIDTSVPSGVPSVSYKVRAVRSTGAGVANIFTVNFGVNSAGEMTATTAPKLAA